MSQIAQLAFTPGPWFVLENPMGPDCIIAEDCRICDMPTWDAEYEDEERANARLIAAAPDLYWALVLLVAGIESKCSETFIPLKKARAALAKAEGTAT